MGEKSWIPTLFFEVLPEKDSCFHAMASSHRSTPTVNVFICVGHFLAAAAEGGA